MRTLLLALLPTAALAGPMYGGTPQSRANVGVFSDKELAKLIEPRLDAHGYVVHLGSADAPPTHPRQRPAPKLKKLDRAALVALHTILSLDLEGMDGLEFDLIVDTPDGERPATLWMDGDQIVVAAGDAVSRPDPVTADAFAEAWPDLPLREIDATWSPELLGLLDLALRTMPAAHRDALAGLELHRRKAPAPTKPGTSVWTPPEGGLGPGIGMLSGRFVVTEDQPPRLEIYDNALRSTPIFVGPLDAPVPAVASVILHELAHALAFRSYDPDAGQTALATAYDEAREHDGPTPYGASHPEEGFAEAYALYHLDRPALERVQPEVAAWMAAGMAHEGEAQALEEAAEAAGEAGEAADGGNESEGGGAGENAGGKAEE